MRNYARILHKSFKQHMFWLFVRIASVRPKHMFYEEIRIKQGLSYRSFCPLRVLYNSEFILLATNAVVVTRVHCITEIELQVSMDTFWVQSKVL